ncbi:GMC oxidoreductase [Limnobacter sp. P1]|uniref:GMC oxidoreductase n=1 Tax=Limnobacter olei TaxID=3031298 RepID=UPI0023B16488|nr:GMC oxidoreductase [Limnobacter sp. P1]
MTPGASVQTDSDLERWVRQTAETAYQLVGTCKMGVDDMAVVDSRLRRRLLTWCWKSKPVHSLNYSHYQPPQKAYHANSHQPGNNPCNNCQAVSRH